MKAAVERETAKLIKMLRPIHSFYSLWLMLASGSSCLPAVTGAAATAAKKHTNNSHRAQNTQPPNVILLLAEDMGLGDLACYGHPYARTPNLDRLAAEGTRFTRFYVAGATCNPSRSGIMSSRNPATIPNCKCHSLAFLCVAPTYMHVLNSSSKERFAIFHTKLTTIIMIN